MKSSGLIGGRSDGLGSFGIRMDGWVSGRSMLSVRIEKYSSVRQQAGRKNKLNLKVLIDEVCEAGH